MISVRAAEPGDVGAIASLLEELDHFYGASDKEPADQRIDLIAAAVFRAPAHAYALLAWEDGRLVGLAAYSFLWPAAGVTQSVYLKELYVPQDYRRRGVGRLLIQSVCRIAAEHGCSRVEWTTDEDNPDAQRFYDVLGVPPHRSKVFYRLEGRALLHMADGDETARTGDRSVK